MALPHDSMAMTEAEYLAFERSSEFKHEYIDGEAFAMTGASRAHNLISVNLITSIRTQLRGKPCQVYPGDMRVKIETLQQYTYPDLSVACGTAQFTSDQPESLLTPTLIVKILSPSTERYDRGKKFQIYRKLPSLQEYVLIAQDSPRIESYRLQDNGTWTFSDVEGLDTRIELNSIGCILDLKEVYDLVMFGQDGDK
jgi:Uma2 family endonuclease